MNPIPFQILVAAASLLTTLFGAAIGAGVAWGIRGAREKQTRKDVNGLGVCMRSGLERADRHLRNLSYGLFVILEKREDRQRLADLLRQQ